MGTTPASILRRVPEHATARTPKEKSSPEDTQGPSSAEKVPFGQKVRSSKRSGHKKGSFAAAYKQALKRTLETPPEELPEPTTKKERSKPSAERSSKAPEPSRKKHRPAGEAEKILLSEVSGESLTAKHATPVFHQPNVTSHTNHTKGHDLSHSKKVLWGPLVLSKKSGPEAPSPPSGPPPEKSKSPPLISHPGTAPAPLDKMAIPPVTEGEKPGPVSGLPTGQKSEKKAPESKKESIEREGKIFSGEGVSDRAKIHAGHKGIPLPQEKDFAGSEEKKMTPFPQPVSSQNPVPEKPTSSPQRAGVKDLSAHNAFLGAAEGGSTQSASSGVENETSPALPNEFQGRIETLARGGGGEVSLDVKPPHLGPVGVRVHVDPHTRLVTVSLASHDPQIRHLLTEKEGSIKESLSQSGFVLDRFQVVSQAPPGSENLSLQGLSGSGMTSFSDGSGGMSGQGGSGLDTAMGGGGTAQDFANLARQGSDASSQERGSGPAREIEGLSLHDQEGPSSPLFQGGEGQINTGYHRIV